MFKTKNKPRALRLHPKTRIEVAEEYGISRRTLKRRLKEAGIRLPPGKIVPADLKLIYETLGRPG
jgi:DNA-binding NtrC family response regulator